MALCPKCKTETSSGSFCGNCGFIMFHDTASAQAAKQSQTGVTLTIKDLENLEAALKKAPTDPMSYVNLAEAQLIMNRLQQAYSTIRAARAISPKHSKVLKISAQVYEAMKRPEDAIKSLTQYLKDDVSDSTELMRLANLLFDLGKKEEALIWLGKGLKRDPNNAELCIRIASIYLSIGNPEEAQKFLNHYKKLAGATPEMYLLMGQTMLSRKFYDGALKNFTEAAQAFPEDVRMQIGLGQAHLAMSEKGKALLVFEKAIEKDASNPEILVELSKLQCSMGLDEKAETSFRSMFKNKRMTGEQYLELAIYFKERKRDNKALEFIKKGQAISPFHPEIQRNLVEILINLRKFSEALELAKEVVYLQAECLWAHEAIVVCAEAMQELKAKAESQLSLIKLENRGAEAWCDYAETLIRLLSFDEAREAFDRAAKLDPTCLRAYQAPELIKIEKSRAQGEKFYKQALEAIKNKFFMTATERLERALKIMPNEPTWIKTMSEVAIKTANLQRASETLSKIRNVDASDYSTAFNLARVYEVQSKHSLAIEILNSVTREHPHEFEAHLLLLRLKRGQMRSVSLDKDAIEAMVKNATQNIPLKVTESPIPTLVKGYAYYLFSARTRQKTDGLAAAECAFNEVLARFGTNNELALKGLLLCERARGDIEKALERADNLIAAASDSSNLFRKGKLQENFQQHAEARKSYASLVSLFPENGKFRIRYLETLAESSKEGSKNHLLSYLSELFQKMRKDSDNLWLYFDTGVGQELAARLGSQPDEWVKRALMTWNKAYTLPNANAWVKLGMIECQLRHLAGKDRLKSINNNIKICEKVLFETPNNPIAYKVMGLCHLAYNDLTHNDLALEFLLKAWFLEPEDCEINLLLAQTAKTVGKSVIVDGIGYNMLLLEPELGSSIFQV
jgi:tetratricopeptide (TPR) repeat protein